MPINGEERNYMNPNLNNPKSVADLGEKIYKEKYQREYESLYTGKFVAINVLSESATVDDDSYQAIANARKKEPNGVFHLIRVGFSGAFQVSHARKSPNPDWLFG